MNQTVHQRVYSDTAGTGPAVNAETGEVTQPGERLQVIAQDGGTPLHAVAQDVPTILRNARALHLVVEAADLRGLPMPFFVGAMNLHSEEVRLQFHTHDEVVTWAEALDVNVRDGRATGHWVGVDVEVVTADVEVQP